MARIMALDYGKRRSGLATTDPLQLIASPLCTVATEELYDYFCNYLQAEEVEALVVGQVLQKMGNLFHRKLKFWSLLQNCKSVSQI